MYRNIDVRLSCVLLVGLLAVSGTVTGAEEGGLNLRFSLPEATVTVSGTVTDAGTGEPIADALVRGHIVIWRHQGPELFEQCPYQEVKTDPNGMYQLTFVTPLTTAGPMKGKDGICVYVSAPGYETRPQYVRPSVTPDKTDFPDVDFAMGPGKCLRGRAVDENNEPIQGALVRVQNGMNGDWNHFGSLGKSYTNENGNFEVWISTERRDYLGSNPWLQISKQGRGTAIFWDILEQEDMGTLVIPECGSVAGKVVDLNGNGVPNCEVLVRKFPVGLVDSTLTNASGEYVLKGVPGDPSLIDFFKRKNRRVIPEWLRSDVYARLDPQMNLRDVPQYQITGEEGKTLSAPDLVVGAEASVSGKLIHSETTFGVKDLMVRLDYSWDNMVEVDAEDRFYFPYVRAGQHRLTAYLPTNLRGDRGIGRVEIDVEPGKSVENVEIELDELAEVRVQFLDINGNPLEGITAGATWSKSGEGFWTEGTRSDENGWAVLSLYPDQTQYVRGFDHSDRSLVAEGFEKVRPKAGEAIGNLRIIMVPPASISGRALSESGEPLAERDLICRIDYADGVQRSARARTDLSGTFELKERFPPGIVRLAMETEPLEFSGATPEPVELKPGEDRDFGDIVLNRVKFYKVTGKLSPSPTFSSLAGFKIRLDLGKWEPMVPTDAEGRFVISKVPEGKHRLTAYLPHNLRTDRGVGHVNIEVKDGDLDGVQLQLETLATIHMRIEDESGNPLEGIAAAAWWTADHSGVFTEGTKSDQRGRATLYLYPDSLQYVGAHDWDGNYRLKEHTEVNLKPGDVLEDSRVIMLSTAGSWE